MYLSNTNSGLHDKIIKCTVQSESFASLSLALNPREDKWRERVVGYGIVKSRKQVNHEYTQPAEAVSNIVLIGHQRAPLASQQGSSSKRPSTALLWFYWMNRTALLQSGLRRRGMKDCAGGHEGREDRRRIQRLGPIDLGGEVRWTPIIQVGGWGGFATGSYLETVYFEALSKANSSECNALMVLTSYGLTYPIKRRTLSSALSASWTSRALGSRNSDASVATYKVAAIVLTFPCHWLVNKLQRVEECGLAGWQASTQVPGSTGCVIVQ